MVSMGSVTVLAVYVALFVYSLLRGSGENIGLFIGSQDSDLASLSDAEEEMVKLLFFFLFLFFCLKITIFCL